MKSPNCRKALITDAIFAKNDSAVVAVVANDAGLACLYVHASRSSRLSHCSDESRQKSV